MNYYKLSKILFNLHRILIYLVLSTIQKSNKNKFCSFSILGQNSKIKKYYFLENLSQCDCKKIFLCDCLILITDFSLVFFIKNILSIKRMRIVDDNFFGHLGINMKINLGFYDFFDQKERMALFEQSIKNFGLLKGKTVGDDLFVLGNNQNFSKDILKVGNNPLIVCNDAIKLIENINTKLLILCFADPMFHFSGLESADNFLNSIKENDDLVDFIIVPQTAVPILNHLEIKSPVIGVSSKTIKKNYQIELKDKIITKKTHNVLTQYMIPIATYLSKNIFVGSVTLDSHYVETSLWKYDEKLVSENEKLFAFDYSFFRDRNFKKYYKMHNKHLIKLLKSNNNILKI